MIVQSFLIRVVVLISLSTTICTLCFGCVQSAQARNQTKNDSVIRLQPEAFAELPLEVVHALKTRRCTIPQTPFYTTPHNIIRGYFAQRGQTDWAVLCSRGGVSTILVFWKGTAERVAEIAPSEDRTFLVDTDGDGVIDYSRVLDSVSGEHILQQHKLHKDPGAPKPPFTHQGISDASLGKASTIHYYHRGEWLKLRVIDG